MTYVLVKYALLLFINYSYNLTYLLLFNISLNLVKICA